MTDTIDLLFDDEPIKWIRELPTYQREAIDQLLSTGASFDAAAQTWVSASTDNTYPFSASAPVGDKGQFLTNLKCEVRNFLCGDQKYEEERKGLFGKKSVVRTYVVSAMAAAIAPYLGVAAAVIAPLIALTLAGIGKITLNAWCAME
jgi:hypothetical protein